MPKEYFPTQSILEAYGQHLENFLPSFQAHFGTRLFRATGDKRYLEPVRSYLENDISKKFSFLEKIFSFNPEEIEIDENIRGTILRNPVENRRIERRKIFYRNHRQLKYYFDAITLLYHFFDWKMNRGKYGPDVEKLLRQYRSFPWREHFLKEEYFRVHPVVFTNAVYQLWEMGMISDLKWFDDMVNQLYPPSEVNREELLFDQVYVYTHIIINESRFYQQFLTEEQVTKKQWILDFFIKHFDRIKSQLNVDLVIEIMLCFFLCRKETNEIIQIGEKYLYQFFDQENNYLRSDDQATFQDMEHANSLFLIYLFHPVHFFTIDTSLV